MLDNFYHDFIEVEVARVPDGVGGTITKINEVGEAFRAGVRLMNINEMKIAEANNIEATYKINIPKGVKVDHKAIVKDKETGAIYRITSNYLDMHTPKISTFDFYIVYAEAYKPIGG